MLYEWFFIIGCVGIINTIIVAIIDLNLYCKLSSVIEVKIHQKLF
jgi:hypothetical protein